MVYWQFTWEGEMRIVLQRVKKASVSVEGKVISQIGAGLVLLVGIKNGDTEDQAKYLAEKCANLRIFEDEVGKLNLSALEVGGEALVVSQFTLYGDTRKGRRPSFIEAAPPEVSKPLFNKFVQYLKDTGLPVQTGIFGAKMLVEILNEGPVTIILDY